LPSRPTFGERPLESGILVEPRLALLALDQEFAVVAR